MNKKIKIEIAVGIILLIAIALGTGIWIGGKKQDIANKLNNKPLPIQKQVQQPNQPEQRPVENTAPQQTAGIVYTNSDFGFQITLPSGWEKYKAIVDKPNNTVHIDLPTTDKTWPGDADLLTGKSLMGYASMFNIGIWSIDSFDKHLADCAKEPDPSCAGKDALLAKGKTYVYEIVGPQAMPEDLQAIVDGGSYIKAIKDNFKMIAITK